MVHQFAGQVLGLWCVCAVAVVATIASVPDPSWATTATPKLPTTRPAPELAPAEVVKVIVGALGQNDATDAGIKMAWAFASPANKDVTGPLENFIPLVKNAQYGALLNHKSAEFRELARTDDAASELVTLSNRDGTRAYYVFQLSRQVDGALKGCWMTDGVTRVEPKAPGAPDATKLPDGQFPA